MKLFGSKHGKYEGRHTSPRRRKRRSTKSLLPLCLVLILGVCLTVGGTLAFMQQKTDTVTNTFKAGDITYTLNLEANAEGVEMPSELTAQSSTSLSATFTPNKAPTKTGYTFGGWYYDTACTDANLHTAAPGTSITVEYGDENDKDKAANKVEITLYAKWTPNTYEVAYNGNGATSGSMANSQHIYDVEKGLTANAYERTGYRFLGWSENQNATTATYTDGQSVMNLTSENGAVVTLYAVWERMDFTVTFDTQAADVTADPASKTVTYQMAYGELPDLTRTGYTFEGWALEKTGETEITSTSIVGLAEDHTLYAQWTPYTYTVKYDNNVDPNNANVTQPTGSTADSTHTYDVAKNLTENGFDRTGYTFIGWNTQPDGKGTSYGNGESVKNLTAIDGDTVTLYAQWGVKSYVLRYHANGGEGTMADQVIEWDKLTMIRENTFTKTDGDYKFAGWSTTPTGEVEYLENQQVVNLLESGTLDLYAVWLLNSYTVTFDYNIGYGTPPTKEVLYGEEYGVLPPYLTTETENLFKGWYTDPEGGERVYPDTIVPHKVDHTLWAHWDPSPANDIIKDLVVHSSADDNKDGVADEMHLEFVCSSSFEKFNIPLHNLVPGQKYALTYTTSNNASFGDYITGYKSARYGSYILPTATEDAGNINTAVAQDIIATWDNRIEPDGTNDGSHAATNDAWLNGPWENRTITFTANATTMYWAWEFGLIQDGIRYDYNIYDISLEPVEPTIGFANKTVLKPSTYNAKIVSQENGTYSTKFTFDGDGGCETVYYPITGLSAGMTYTITFDHEFSGPLIHDTKNVATPTYEYGTGIMNAVPVTGDKMTSLGTWASNTFVKKTVDGKVDSVTLTFKATGSTAYWVWNMANCSDGTNTTTKVTITSFSASNSGNSVTYYTAASNAGSAVTLDLMPEEEHEIHFAWDGIDDTNMEIWYPVDEQYPVAGDSYELAFEPLEGYTMAEVITVVIDGVTYEVYTNGQTEDGAIVPVYDPEANVLSIPAELLTTETTYVSVTASAVPVEIIITTEQTETTETEPVETEETETETVAEEAIITVAMNLTNMTAQGDTTLQVGEDYTIVLVPDDGYQLPEIIRVEIDGTLYEVYTDGLDHRTLGAGGTELPPMPTFDPATGTLTIPAILLGESTQNVTITISAVEIVDPTETKGSEETTETEASEVATEEETEESTDTTDLTTVSSGDAALPPDNKEEGTADDEAPVDPDGGEDGTNSDGADSTTETTEGSSEEVAE